MCNQKGFTLVELLIAATIIGILAVFATTQYRNSAAETRWVQAKSKADQLAFSIERARKDYPSITFTADALGKTTSHTCNLHPGQVVDLTALISCGYMENAGDEYFEYYSCDYVLECAGYQAMVKAKDTAKLPAAYKSMKYYASSVIGNKEVK